jgi:putative ABC transport system permease protein
MRLLNPIKISYKNLVAAKFRSFLTILGIIIGVASVIIIMAVGLSAQELILDQVRGIGSNLIGVLPGASEENGPPATALGISITTLTYDDLQAMKDQRNIPEVEDVAGYVMGTSKVKYEEADFTFSFTGTTASYIDVENAEMEVGRFLNEEEEVNLSRVAVLGSGVAEEMFGTENPLNKKIKIDNNNFVVIGVLKSRSSAAFGTSSQNDTIYIPLRTAQNLLLGISHLGFARLKVKSSDLIPIAIENTKITLRDQHDIDDPADDDFSVRDQAAAVETISNITDVLRYFLLAIGTISLIVGGVGIMNVMLIAVNQRIREVGLRKAIGARNIDIALQFLVESATISFLGGAVGIVIGVLLSFVISTIVQALGYTWPFLISFWSVIVAAVVSIVIGIIFGMYPARKASQVSPMEALRYE